MTKLAGTTTTRSYPIKPGRPGYSITSTTLSSQLGRTISNLIGFLTLIAALGFIFYFIIGTINLISASGDTQKVKTAQQQILNAIIGIIITAIAYPAISLITSLLGIPLANPEELINQFVF